jgi:hypothetical protein
MSTSIGLWTIGYGRWPAKNRWQELTAALKANRIDLLIDIRHSPCASSLEPTNSYGPREWHLQKHGGGITAGLRREGIRYAWLVELGNPQKNDKDMGILREHISNPSADWPIHRGLIHLKRLVLDEGNRCCLMCACAEYETCHRKLVVDAFRELIKPVSLDLESTSAAAFGKARPETHEHRTTRQ